MNPRLRRLKPRIPIGHLYEVELPTEAGVERRFTRSPVALLSPLLGVGDAWALVDAANRKWNGQVGEWVSLFEPGAAP